MSKPLKKIICIDDEADILEVASMCLEEVGGFEVIRCSNGTDGLAKAIETKPDLIMLDCMMPTLDGPATLKKLHENAQTKDIPIIFMTARVQDDEKKQYVDMGAIGVIEKPFDPMRLAGQVSDLWEGGDGL